MSRSPSPPMPKRMEHTDVMVYPCYIDSGLKRRKGRKISKEEGILHPTLDEIAYCAQELGFTGGYDPERRHPSCFWSFGRLIVHFWTIDEKTKEKTPLHPTIHSRMQLYREISKKLKEVRLNPPGRERMQVQKKLHGVEKTRMKKLMAKGLIPRK